MCQASGDVVFFLSLPSFQQDTTSLGHSPRAPPCLLQSPSGTLPSLPAYFSRA